MTNSGNIFSDKLTNWLIYEAWFKHSHFQMSIYYKYEPEKSKWVFLSYVYECVYWYKYEELGNWFVDTLGKGFHVNFLGYAHCFMSIRISKLEDYSISVDQARYDKSAVSKYLFTATVKENPNSHKTTLPHDMIFNK